jgi:hypothetical protein
MTTPSSLYAEKIYAEHPIGLWSLDDDADYVSLITEAQRDISDGWTITNGTASSSTSSIGQPFIDSALSLLQGTVSASTSETLVCVSEDLVNFTNLNNELGNISVGSYFYADTAFLQSVSIGYEYTDTGTSQIVQELKTFNTDVFQQWAFVSGTFNIPQENTSFRVVLKFTVNNASTSSVNYDFYVNGITAGQWSEDFNTTSLGVTPISLPSSIVPVATECIEADPYGLSGNTGYYLIKDNSLLAKNSSIPMVYGSNSVIKLFPNTPTDPSLIIPGNGFLNESGQFKDYTVEFWMRVNSDAYTPRKIFGPIASSDGLYVESGFLTLVIGEQFSSYFVGEWFRPMLVDIRLIKNNASVLINGEEVINIPIETDNLVLPEEYNASNENQDWLGFYAYEDVSPVEIDCIAIYSYSVSVSVAKRRWVYGQGVISPEDINSAYGGTQAFIDYTFADYTANYNYPDFASWEQGSFDNLNTTSFTLETPQYSLPEIFVQNKTLQELYDDNQDIQSSGEKFLTFRPNGTWNSLECYFNFPRLNILNTPVAAIYGVFSSDDLASEEVLFKIYNPTTFNSFIIKKDLDEIVYILNFNGNEDEIYRTDIIVEDEKYAAGIQIDNLVNSFGGNISSFFGNQSGLQMYAGGDETGLLQFTGKIYSIGLCTKYNANEILSNFEENGTAILDSHLATGSEESQNAKELLAHTASYTILPTEAYSTYYLDIGVSGYWEDYLPLSYFAQFVKNDVGNTYYDLDFLQLNIANPSPTKLAEYETVSSWSYDELNEEFAHPVQQTYYQLDNFLITGWNDYEDMDERAAKYYEYDTSDAVVRSYITLQYVKDGANAPQDSFTTVEPAREGGIINIDDYPNWLTTKFEIVDNTLLYPTATVNFNKLALVTRIEFNSRGILTKPIRLKKLEVASQAFNDNSFNPIGTRFGINIFPFTKSGIYYDYKAKNPYSIYKGSTPYLYLNRLSGVQVRGDFDPLVSRGISVPINSTVADNYRISATQIWMRYDQERFPAVPVDIFEINYKDDTIKFYVVAVNDQGTRARVFAKSLQTGEELTNITYYLNGYLVKDAILTAREWAVLGTSFATALGFDSFLGNINITGPLVFNNIAFYQNNNLQQVQSNILRPWIKVQTDGPNWQYWANSYTWQEVLIVATTDLYGVNPADVYETYIGTNKIIFDDDEGMILDAQNVKIYNDTIWTIRVGSAV